MLKRFTLVLALLFILIFSPKVYADDFKKDYTVDYFVSESKDSIQARVVFNIRITNLNGQVVIKSFALRFPQTFTIHDIKASSNGEPISPQISSADKNLQVQIELPNAVGGTNEVNTITIELLQDNLFKVNGNVWEVILPNLDASERNSYQVNVHLPEQTPKKISISKPAPTSINGTQITWENPQTKTIYAVFGDEQLYQTQITYHLNNPKIVPVYTDIALIPDTAYQKIYLTSLLPAPSKVFQDEDGNYMARYILNPKQAINPVLKETIAEYVKPRDEVRDYVKTSFARQKPYLLNSTGYWSLKKAGSFNTAQDIYNYVSTHLTYNYSRLGKKIQRLGAQAALDNPTLAVCTEFTDSFVALARMNGIYSREIQGYGFSNDPQLRPISLISDILHAWPEYYDETQRLWIPVDPTWGNTSGIDYFSALDLNHIVFAIHGKQSDYPYPAGTYKQEESKDIHLEAVANVPNEKKSIVFDPIQLPNQIVDDKPFIFTTQVVNNGNTYGWSIPVELKTNDFTVQNGKKVIDSIAPLEKRSISFTLIPKKRIVGKSSFTLYLNSVKTGTYSVNTVPFYYDIALKGWPVGILALLIALAVLLRRKKV